MIGCTYDAKVALANAYREITNEDIMPLIPRESKIALANKNLIADPYRTYEDLGFVVSPEKGANLISWKYLIDQVKSEYNHFNVNPDSPFIVTGLYDLEKDDIFKDEGGLKRILNGLTRVYNFPILRKGDRNLYTRTLYTAQGGVRRLCRLRGLRLHTWEVDLTNSGDVGRMHVVKK